MKPRPKGCAPTVERVDERRTRARDVEVAYAARAGVDELLPQRGVGDDVVDRGRDGVRVLDVEQESGVAERLGNGRGRVGDDRDAVVHGFEQRHAESFVLAADDEHVGGAVVRGELGRGDAAGERDGVVEARARG